MTNNMFHNNPHHHKYICHGVNLSNGNSENNVNIAIVNIDIKKTTYIAVVYIAILKMENKI